MPDGVVGQSLNAWPATRRQVTRSDLVTPTEAATMDGSWTETEGLAVAQACAQSKDTVVSKTTTASFPTSGWLSTSSVTVAAQEFSWGRSRRPKCWFAPGARGRLLDLLGLRNYNLGRQFSSGAEVHVALCGAGPRRVSPARLTGSDHRTSQRCGSADSLAVGRRFATSAFHEQSVETLGIDYGGDCVYVHL